MAAVLQHGWGASPEASDFPDGFVNPAPMTQIHSFLCHCVVVVNLPLDLWLRRLH
jgi:hypothetical protein